MSTPVVSSFIAYVLALSLITAMPAGAENQKPTSTEETTPKSTAVTNRPSAQEIVLMARNVKFDDLVVTDQSVTPEIRQLNTKFYIKVFYRAKSDTPKDLPAEGAILAKVIIGGVPAKQNLPDGDYYLWLGRGTDAPQASLIKSDGRIHKELEVLPKSFTAPESVTASTAASGGEPHDKIIALVGPVPGPPFPFPPRPPPPPPPPQTWRAIWVPAPNWDHQGGGRWIRVPDN